ncbi:3-hydroxybutyryl-CoA dehydrogenase [Candidatus Spongiihabitans sp.]|uniref:3-hydroxybutyryl-CoA dehydrogenase n=1 Tax=Candidatus Spongiihabitans sp. TaxID=3101308 RepID=UPI003C6F48BA
MDIKAVGVIGAGTMGNGIAQVFAASGFNVMLVDVDHESLERGARSIESSLERLLKKEKISADEKSSALLKISTTTDINILSQADFVIEAVVENFEVKAGIFNQLDSLCKSGAVLASNTSSISLTRIAAQTNRPDKVIGMHFMNPVPVMQLIEIIRAMQTSDQTCQLAESVSHRLGKTPVVANDSPGFVSNRILIPMINEAIFALHEGVATAQAIDEIMKLGMNHPIGPLALADLIGLDVCLSVLEVLQDGMGDPKFRPCPLLKKMVDANHLGRKTGKGFYEYR